MSLKWSNHVVASAALLAISCTRDRCLDAEHALIEDLSRRLIFVGEFPGKQRLPPVHDSRQTTVPSRLERGKQYVFHSAAPIDDFEFAVHVLPDTLRRLKFEVTSAPKTRQGLVAIDPGGLVWRITFRCGGLTGELYNAPDPILYSDPRPQGSRDDYIIVMR